MRRLLLAVVVVVAIGGAALYVNHTGPSWYQRLRYPLRYSEFVRGAR